MKIQFISDLHGQWMKIILKQCDILCITGDIFEENTEDELTRFTLWLKAHFDCFKKVIIVPGNHDRILTIPTYKRRLHSITGVFVAIDELLVINGIEFKCFSWCNLPYWAFYMDNFGREQLLTKTASCDIFLSHCPAYGVLDVGGFFNDSLGLREIADYISKFKPVVHAHGHIHECYGVHRTNELLTLNTALCDAHNNIVVNREPMLIDIDPITKLINYSECSIPYRTYDE